MESITDHKAGIIKPHGLALTGVTQLDLLSLIEDEARRCQVALHTVGPAWDDSCDWTFKYKADRLPRGRFSSPFIAPMLNIGN